MIHKLLEGKWSLSRLRELFNAHSEDPVNERTDIAKEIVNLLTVAQNMPLERIARITEMPIIGGMTLEFGDGSGVTLKGEPLTQFMSNYIRDREQYITIMEANRRNDPRVNGDLARLQELLRLTEAEYLSYKITHPPL